MLWSALKARNEEILLFQVLDRKKECYAVFCDEDLYHYPNSLKLTHTWDYSAHFADQDIEYAKIWCLGKDMTSICPEHLKEEWESLNSLARSYLISFQEAKINLDDVCFYDLVPKKFLISYCSTKNKITDWVFEHYKRPRNYLFLSSLIAMLDEISNRKLNLRIENLDFIDSKVRSGMSKIKNAKPYIKYNPWGTVTGRLSTAKESFPILTLNKELRDVIVPRNDAFVELDFNSAELRTLFGLLGEKQPEEDIHSWIGKSVFENAYSRDETKKKVFSWLYNPEARNDKLNDYLKRDDILKKYYIDGVVQTPFGRTIEADDSKALNYLIQSTSSDLFLTSAIKINNLLKNRSSFISFCVHDSLVIDYSKEDHCLIQEILECFGDTKFGRFKTNLSIGKSYGAMRRVE